MSTKAQSCAAPPGVAAAAAGDGDSGFFWIADGNERDPAGSDLACDAVRTHLSGRDFVRTDLGELVAEIDRDVLPAAARARGVPGLPLGILVGRASGRSVTVAFVGEARAHLLDGDGRLTFVSREHNAYNAYPESIWRDQLGYSEERAKTTILGVVGGGTADVEIHLLPRPARGALIGASHLWHRYDEPGARLDELQRLAAGRGLDRLEPGRALAILRW